MSSASTTELPRQGHNQCLLGDQSVILLQPRRMDLGVEPIRLSNGKYTIGRHDDCDVILEFEGVAEQHCRLVIRENVAQIEAISPLTWVNDGPVREETISAGDRVVLGPIEFDVEFPAVLSERRGFDESIGASSGVDELLRYLALGAQSSFEYPAAVEQVQPQEDEVALPNHSAPELPSHDEELADSDSDVDSEIMFLQVQQAELQEQQAEFDRQRRTFQSELRDLECQRDALEVLKSQFEEREQSFQESNDAFQKQRNLLERQSAAMSQLDANKSDLEQTRANLQNYSSELELRAETLHERVLGVKRIRHQQRAQEKDEGDANSQPVTVATDSEASTTEKDKEIAQRIDELKSIQAQVTVQCDEFVRCKHELDETRRSVDEWSRQQKIDVERRAAILEVQSTEMAQKLEQLRADESRIQEQRTEIDEQLKSLEEKAVEIHAKEQELKAQREQLDQQAEQDLQSSISEQTEFLNFREQQIASMVEMAQLEREQLENDRRLLSSVEQDVLAKITELQFDTNTLKEIEESLIDQEAALQAELHEFQLRQQQFEDIHEQVSQFAAKLEDWDQSLTEREQQIAERERSLDPSLIVDAATLREEQERLQRDKEEFELAQQELECTRQQMTEHISELEQQQSEIEAFVAKLSSEQVEFQTRLKDLERREAAVASASKNGHATQIESAASTSEGEKNWDESWVEFGFDSENHPPSEG